MLNVHMHYVTFLRILNVPRQPPGLGMLNIPHTNQMNRALGHICAHIS